MNTFRSFFQNYRSISLLTIFFALASSHSILSVNAKPILGKVEITQALTDSQTQTIQKKAENLLELLGKKDYQQVSNLISPELQKYWPPEKIQFVWEEEISKNGAYEKIINSSVVDVINSDIVRLTVQFAKQTEDVLVTFDKQQRLIGLDSPSSGEIEELATDFINTLADKDYALAREYISPLLRVEFIPTRIQRGWESLLTKNGSFQKIVSMKTIPSDTPNVPDVVIAKIQFENRTDDLFLFFNDEKRIVNIDHS